MVLEEPKPDQQLNQFNTNLNVTYEFALFRAKKQSKNISNECFHLKVNKKQVNGLVHVIKKKNSSLTMKKAITPVVSC